MTYRSNLEIPRELCHRPLLLPPNRVRRTYQGGALLEAFRGYAEPADGWWPEDWIGSTAVSRLDPNEGLSRATSGADTVLLRDLIERFPKEMLGAEHVRRFGNDPHLLVKLLDSCERLRIQVHPTREKAQALLDSPHGKTEAWIVLATRSVNGNEPYLLLGFKPGVEPERFQRAVLGQDTPALEHMLHKVPVKPGDVFFIEAGTPHAIGPGVFMIEVQEPSDYTVYVEASQGDLVGEGAANHMGVGWERAFECFHYEGRSVKETLKRWKWRPRVVRKEDGGQVASLLDDPRADGFFRSFELSVTGSLSMNEGTFYSAIVVDGSGAIAYDEGVQPVKKGEIFFLPAALGLHHWRSDSIDRALRVIACHPPK